MSNARFSLIRIISALLAGATISLAAECARAQQQPALDDLLSAVVKVKTYINPDGRTLKNLGREREGSGVVIDSNGLVLTIGYLMVEAYAAQVTSNDGHSVAANIIGYDHETGFGLLQAVSPLKVKPLAFGKAAELRVNDPVLIAAAGGRSFAGAAIVVARRGFAGSWEYLLDDAIFTSPPHPAWSGAALLTREGKLVGIGSLIVGDASGHGVTMPGNMFVPIDLLPPILGDLIADGRAARAPRPWLGVSVNEVRDRLLVDQVTPGGPSERAGIRRGDIIVGVNREMPQNLADFFRKVWTGRRAGATVPLDVLRDGETRRVDVESMDRLDHLRLKSTF
jgi:serine protease Do